MIRTPAKKPRNPHQAGFPKKCLKCGRATKKVMTGKMAGTYHCSSCGTYQEWAR